MRIFATAFAALLATKGLFMALAPQRFGALELWRYRLIGARPAEPGRGTFLFHRLSGIALCAVAAFLFLKILPE